MNAGRWSNGRALTFDTVVGGFESRFKHGSLSPFGQTSGQKQTVALQTKLNLRIECVLLLRGFNERNVI